jgi:hypothetical protein
MDREQFDALTRTVASGNETRRGVLRLLVGTTLGGLAARLRFAEGAEARQKRQKRAQRKGREPLQVEGKGKKKGKKKPKPKPRPLPPCGDGRWQCADGSCVPNEQCCPGEKACGGGVCVSANQCCNNERSCADESCVAANQCCVGEKRCGDGSCIPFQDCCPGEKQCDDLLCIPEDECCPEAAAPICAGCQDVVCENGELTCRSTGQAPCQEGCCPHGYWCHYLGSCCTDGPPFHCTCPSGYGPCAGRCCKRCCGSFCCAGS